ncbi:MAG: YmdB family metallophosphoesterase, partial [Thermomicrobiales bacterium]
MTDPTSPGPTGGPANLRVLMVGDIMGSPGRKALRRLLPAVRKEAAADLVIANGENSAGGRGISVRTANEMHDAGVDVITTGNHIWAQQ